MHPNAKYVNLLTDLADYQSHGKYKDALEANRETLCIALTNVANKLDLPIVNAVVVLQSAFAAACSTAGSQIGKELGQSGRSMEEVVLLLMSNDVRSVIARSGLDAITSYLRGLGLSEVDRDAIEIFFEATCSPEARKNLDNEHVKEILGSLMDQFAGTVLESLADLFDVMVGVKKKPKFRLIKNDSDDNGGTTH